MIRCRFRVEGADIETIGVRHLLQPIGRLDAAVSEQLCCVAAVASGVSPVVLRYW